MLAAWPLPEPSLAMGRTSRPGVGGHPLPRGALVLGIPPHPASLEMGMGRESHPTAATPLRW